jgi:isoleucyl-tRNA synthetase
MSKTRGNTADPFEMFDMYGADATRWYLLSTSPAWSPTRFDEEGLKEVSGKFFGTLRNLYHFFVLYANQDDMDPRTFQEKPALEAESDRWILSRYHRLIRDCIADMDVYDHMKAVRRIQTFTTEDFSNWYIRRSRRRFWGEARNDDKKAVYAVTHEILTGVARLMAPFAPFISDEIYRNLTDEPSVHLALYPAFDSSLLDDALEEKMELVRSLVSLGRGVREKEQIKVRQPLSAILIDGKHEEVLAGMSDLILEELNIKEVKYQKNLSDFMDFSVKPDFKAAGPVLGPRMKAFAAALGKTDATALITALEEGEPVVFSLKDAAVLPANAPEGEDEILLERSFVDVGIHAKDGFAVAMGNGLFTILDTTLTPALCREGLAREMVSKVQQIRKQMDLEMMDNIRIRFESGEEAREAFAEWKDYICRETLALSLEAGDPDPESTWDLNGYPTSITVEKV